MEIKRGHEVEILVCGEWVPATIVKLPKTKKNPYFDALTATGSARVSRSEIRTV